MNAPALSIAFFDPAHSLHGTARQGMTLLFRDGSPTALPEGPELEPDGDGLRAQLADRLDLRFEPVSGAVDLGGAYTRVCRVAGTAGDEAVDCLGTVTETVEPPAWAELDALRAISALFDEGHGLLALARRPRGALGHGDERVRACLLAGGELLGVEDSRISTVYDGDGRQRDAGLELWLPGEDFPRRASGRAVAGASLNLEGLRVQVAVFGWRMEGREGAGAYEVTVRDEPAAA
ncbi:MAG: hypothetical protein M3N16_08815 [Actinomycetota bacterium]|nr:hypothetical protein [Actinomycetota bacterium]